MFYTTRGRASNCHHQHHCIPSFLATIFSIIVMKKISVDAAFVTGFLIWVVGIGLAIPLKFVLWLFKLFDEHFLTGATLPYLYVIILGRLIRYHQRKLREKAAADITYEPNKPYQQFLATVAYTIRPKVLMVYYFFTTWFFMIEHLTEINELGWAMMIFYYVVMTLLLVGCCREFDDNDF